jgi:hypothetical protein
MSSKPWPKLAAMAGDQQQPAAGVEHMEGFVGLRTQVRIGIQPLHDLLGHR